MLVFDIDGLSRRSTGPAAGSVRHRRAIVSACSRAGLGLFVATWWRGSRSLFLTGGSYLLGALVLLLLNVLALASHELATRWPPKHAGREVPAAGLLVYFGIPSVFVDTTDVWMAGRRARMLVTAAGPAPRWCWPARCSWSGWPCRRSPARLQAGLRLVLNVLFNLNPFLALDGYYLLMDWLEIPNCAPAASPGCRPAARPPPRWVGLDREGRIIALYGVLACSGWRRGQPAYRIWADRISGLATGLWHAGPLGALLLVLVCSGSARRCLSCSAGSPAGGALARRARRERTRGRRPRRLAALRASDLGGLPEPALAGLAAGPAGCTRRPAASSSRPAARSPPSTWSSTARCRPASPATRRHDPPPRRPGGVVGLATR
jgi:putative peptide zinc metalloprotease protein